jgi:nicotinamide mononucleotide transporter
MTPLEISANIVTVLSVWLAARNHVLTWPTGILSGLLYGVMFFEARLYADVTLQLFFMLTSIKGWWDWTHGGNLKAELPITRVTLMQLFSLYFPLSLLTAAAYGAMLYYLTNASYPFIDSLVLVFSVIAQLLLMRRKLENWAFWLLVDVIAVPLYATKGLYITSAVYAVFLGNAFYGYFAWWQTFRRASDQVVAVAA